MGHPASGLNRQGGASEFALIGHAASWASCAAVVRTLRGSGPAALSDRDVREILPWIPPRTVCRVTVRSQLEIEARGVYIDCFIPPDQLGPRSDYANLQRIREAASYAVREGALIATLGGFSSILLEGKVDFPPPECGTVFTTGNTLTVAYIVQGLSEAARLSGRRLSDLTVLIVGATGDVGSGCARYLAGLTKGLLLCARNPQRLRKNWETLRRQEPAARAATDISELLPDADAIICVASLPSPSLVLSGARSGAIVCDAGYPPNLHVESDREDTMVFSGGLGQIRAGYRLEPDLTGSLSRHPFPNVVHGCLLEGMVLALEKRYEAFSHGRGNITSERVNEIWELALKHGFALAPFFHGDKRCSEPLGMAREALA